MNGSLDAHLWWQLFLTLGAGVATIALLSAALASCLWPATWRRTVWQAGTLAMLALFAVEVCGVGEAIVVNARSAVWPSRGDPLGGSDDPTRHVIDSAVAGQPLDELANRGEPEPAPERPTTGAGEGDPLSPLRATDRPLAAESIDSTAELDRLVNYSPADGAVDIPSSKDSSSVAGAGPPIAPTDPAPQPPRAVLWLPGVLWFAGTLALLGRLLVGSLLLGRFRRRLSRWREPRLVDRIRALGRELGLRRKVRLLESPHTRSPMAFGVLRPTIVLPSRFTIEYEASQQDAMLAHELAHLAAHDGAWHALAEIAAALLWWHPLAWWSRYRLQVESEYAADEATRVVPEGPSTLATCLVALGSRLARSATPKALRVEGKGFGSVLGRRVQRLLRLKEVDWHRPGCLSRHLLRSTGTFAVLAVALLGTVLARTPPVPSTRQPGQPAQPEGEVAMQLTSHSFWKHSLAGVVVLGLFGPTGADAQDSDRPETGQLDDASGLLGDLLDEEQLRDQPDDTGDPKKTKQKERQQRKQWKEKQLSNDASDEDFARSGFGLDASGDDWTAGRSRSDEGAGLLPSRGLTPRGSGLYLDLVNLATSAADAQGDLRLYKHKVDRLRALTARNVVSADELEVARINYEKALMKVQLYNDMAKAALRSNEMLLAALHAEAQLAEERYKTGHAPVSDLNGIRSQLAVAEGNLAILKSILSRTRAAGTTAKKPSAKPGAVMSIVIGDHAITFDPDRLPSADELEAVMAPLPEAEKRGHAVLKIPRDVNFRDVRRILATLDELGFQKVDLEMAGTASDARR